MKTKELQKEIDKDSYGRTLPEDFILEASDGSTLHICEKNNDKWTIRKEGKDGTEISLSKSSLISFSKEDFEAIFKILKIVERIKELENLEFSDFELYHTVPIKIGQLCQLTPVEKTLNNILLFSDEDLHNIFFVKDQWSAYRDWLRTNAN